MTIIPTDRSRLECFEGCNRKRFWLYEWQGGGLEKADDLKIDARIGTWTHWGIEYGLEVETKDIPGPSLSDAAIDAGNSFTADCAAIVDPTNVTDQLKHDIAEGGWIVTALVYAWLRVKAPRLLADGDVLAIEKELMVDFPVGSDVVRLMARPDIIWRRHVDGGIFIRNLKTVRIADDRWREKWALDMQTMSEPLAVDAEIARDYYNGEGPTVYQKGPYVGNSDPLQCGGVIIDGLVTGKITSAKSQFSGLYHHNNQLVYCFRQELPDGSYLYQPEYKYGLQKCAVSEVYPGGIAAWVDYLIEHHPEIVSEYIIELPPIIRSEYQIERWKRQVLLREVEIHKQALWLERVAAKDNGEYLDAEMDKAFPMHTSNGNCLYPGKCAAYDLCWGSAAADPLNSGYRLRVPNHPQEGESK